ncbi:efflux RND transporter periplasmic adaptor subunit [Hyphomicrobium sp.]|jgi:multidrug efflux system membrane fusion protein|uniref:efflux RND transporter periplasmic adaptor subunit n=1 Tax=Hyphomicrobium sp. TaxID=82 RepID=UPI003563A4A3
MRVWKAVVLGLVLLGGGTAYYFRQDVPKLIAEIDGKGAAPPPGAFVMPVPVTPVVKRAVSIYLDYSARTESINDITLQARVAGYVQQQHVADGSDVKTGELLYTIDPRDYQAALDRAKAEKQRDVAARDYASSNLERGTELTKSGWLAKDTFDQRSSSLRQTEAGISIDDAAIRTAELNLEYTQIRAPFDGRLGKNQASIGTLISIAGAPLNTLVQLDPIYVTFNPAESDLAAIEKVHKSGAIAAEILVPGDSKPPHKGTITFVDNAVDRLTGTLTARATIANADRGLLPGQYVRIHVHAGENPNALMVPQTAIGSSQLGKYVYVVGDKNIAQQKLVTLGPTDGDLVSVVGLEEKDLIITGNLQKIGPGSPVQPITAPPPQAKASLQTGSLAN